MNRLIATFLTLSVMALGVAATASADVIRVDVESRADVAGGMAYGLAGPYEKLTGMVHFEVDPANPANRIVTDIDFAPRNDRGMVEFRSNFFLLKPKDAARGNGTVLYEVSNRGGKGMLGYFNNAAGSRDPRTAEEMGDGFLLENGFSLLWLGWQFDVPVRDGQMRLHTPVATDDGNPLTGLVRSEVIVNQRAYDRSLADRNHIAYPVADPDNPANVMTVRDGVDQPRRVVPRDQWRFARRNDDGSVVDDPTRVYLEGGFEPFKIYDVVYVAQDPAPGRTRTGGGARHDLADEVRGDAGAGPAGRRHRARHRLGRLAERTLPADVPLPRLQRRRAEPTGVRRRDVARGRRRPRQLQPPLRAAVTRRPSAPEQALPERHLPVHRRGTARPGDRHAGRPARGHPAGATCRRSSTRTRPTSTGVARRR